MNESGINASGNKESFSNRRHSIISEASKQSISCKKKTKKTIQYIKSMCNDYKPT